MTDFVSIVVLSYRVGAYNRSEMFRQCLNSLLESTTYPYELIIVDNTQNNRGLGLGRNSGFSQATGRYICFTDDDILFKPGWLEECLEMLSYGEKYIATPIHQPRIGRWERESINGHRQNYRAGSNCMVMRRESFLDIGLFYEGFAPPKNVRFAGCQFCNRQVAKGYTVLLTIEPKAIDLGFRKHSYVQTI